MTAGAFRERNSKAAKLDAQLVQDMRWEYKCGATQGSLSRKYELSIGQVGRILRREAWQWVPDRIADEEIAASQARLQKMMQDEGLVEPTPADPVTRIVEEANQFLNPAGLDKFLRDDKS